MVGAMRCPRLQDSLFRGFSPQLHRRRRGEQQSGKSAHFAEGALPHSVAGGHAHLVGAPWRKTPDFCAGAQAQPGLFPFLALLCNFQSAYISPCLLLPVSCSAGIDADSTEWQP